MIKGFVAAAGDASIGGIISCVAFDSGIPVVDDLLRYDTAGKFGGLQHFRWCLDFDFCTHLVAVNRVLNLVIFIFQALHNNLHSVGAICDGRKFDDSEVELGRKPGLALALALLAELFEDLHDVQAAHDEDLVSQWDF